MPVFPATISPPMYKMYLENDSYLTVMLVSNTQLCQQRINTIENRKIALCCLYSGQRLFVTLKYIASRNHGVMSLLENAHMFQTGLAVFHHFSRNLLKLLGLLNVDYKRTNGCCSVHEMSNLNVQRRK